MIQASPFIHPTQHAFWRDLSKWTLHKTLTVYRLSRKNKQSEAFKILQKKKITFSIYTHCIVSLWPRPRVTLV